MSELQTNDTAEVPAVETVLAKHFGHSPPPVRVTFGALSHPGRVRATTKTITWSSS
jgi:hypothetical protein